MPTVEAQLGRLVAKVRRLRWQVVILSAIIVLGAVVVPFGVTYIQRRVTENATVRITCISTRANIAQLAALEALEHRLGVPVDFTIPDLPEECR